ncbi:HNH endonuclease [Nonomuraea sp. NPDC003754]
MRSAGRSRKRPSYLKGEQGRALKHVLAARHGSRCFYCGTPYSDPTVATFDHYLPYWLWRRYSRSNLVLACEPCNQAKADMLPWPLVWLLLAAVPA